MLSVPLARTFLLANSWSKANRTKSLHSRTSLRCVPTHTRARATQEGELEKRGRAGGRFDVSFRHLSPHLSYPAFAVIMPNALYCTTLREPLSRFVSLFNFVGTFFILSPPIHNISGEFLGLILFLHGVFIRSPLGVLLRFCA